MNECVYYLEENNIGNIVLNRPEKLNALSEDFLCELDRIISEIDFDRIRCLVFKSSSEKSFIAGADIREMADLDVESSFKYSQLGQSVFEKIRNIPIPTVAFVNGYTFGGGCELMLSCDIRIASNRGKFGFPEVSLGILPGFGGTQILPKVVGISRAKLLIYTGKTINADEAKNIGLVDDVFPSDVFEEEGTAIVQMIVNNAPIAIKYVKQLISLDPEDFEKESKLFSQCFKTKDAKNGMQAFLDKKERVFKGN